MSCPFTCPTTWYGIVEFVWYQTKTFYIQRSYISSKLQARILKEWLCYKPTTYCTISINSDSPCDCDLKICFGQISCDVWPGDYFRTGANFGHELAGQPGVTGVTGVTGTQSWLEVLCKYFRTNSLWPGTQSKFRTRHRPCDPWCPNWSKWYSSWTGEWTWHLRCMWTAICPPWERVRTGTMKVLPVVLTGHLVLLFSQKQPEGLWIGALGAWRGTMVTGRDRLQKRTEHEQNGTVVRVQGKSAKEKRKQLNAEWWAGSFENTVHSTSGETNEKKQRRKGLTHLERRMRGSLNTSPVSPGGWSLCRDLPRQAVSIEFGLCASSPCVWRFDSTLSTQGVVRSTVSATEGVGAR